MKNNLKNIFIGSKKYFWTAAALVVLFDQFTKYVFFRLSLDTPHLVVVPNFFNIVQRGNPAAAFSLGPESPLFYIIATVIGLFVLIWLLADAPPDALLPVLGLGTIAGGAVGNLADRFFIGEVRDFIDLHWFWRFHWPAFNVADAAICIGVTMIIIESFRKFSHSEKCL